MKYRLQIFVLLIFLTGVGLLAYSLFHIADAVQTYREGNQVYEEILETVREKESWSPFDFEELRKMNPQIRGWIRLEGTIIDYPVVQGDDNVYYLNHLSDGTENWMGSVFIDYRSDGNLEDRLTPVYAHHTNNGAMFYLLEQYKYQSFYDEHPQWNYYSEQDVYELIPFAGTVVDSSTSFLRLSFKDEADFRRYINTFRVQSTFQPKESYDGENVIMLCTCTDDYENARYVLLCAVKKCSSK